MKKIRSIFLCCGVCLLACAREPELKELKFEYALLPEGQGVPLVMKRDSLRGSISDKDKVDVLNLVGRLKGVHPEVHRMDACWEDYTVAVRVFAGKQEVYCTKDERTRWRIVRVITVDE